MFRQAWRYRRKIITTFAILLMLVWQNANATDNWNVDGEHGELHIHGLLVEGACQLDMRSSFQDVSLGSIARGAMLNPGDMGKPVSFQIRLVDCPQSGGAQIDRYNGVRFHDAQQPVVTISFLSVSKPSNPSLMAVHGVAGIGLRLVDALGRTVRFGTLGEPQFLTPGSNELVYTITPVRTTEPLTTGDFYAVTNFEVGYE